MQNMFNVKLPWGSVSNGQEKVVLSVVELESFRSEISSLEERESQYKTQLEHIDGILRSARLSGYLFVRMEVKELKAKQMKEKHKALAKEKKERAKELAKRKEKEKKEKEKQREKDKKQKEKDKGKEKELKAKQKGRGRK